MPVTDTLNLPILETLLIAIAVAIPSVLAVWRVVRRSVAGRGTRATLARRVDDLSRRLEATEVRLAEENSETGRLHQRVEHLASRLEALSASTSRGGLRQAIALSKHGATTRHLIDTCGLSQGEAHLIQTLYGRTPGIDQPEELH